MQTLLISDLHLGSASGADLLQAAPIAELLLGEVAAADRLVLLGDALELRHGPAQGALDAGGALFSALGEAMAGREIVICPGNHDYALLAPWLAQRSAGAAAGPLGIEQLIDPRQASSALAELAERFAPARLTVAYPGLWVREDVYATHGHYLDCHATLPTLERLGIGAMARILSRPCASLACVEDYESLAAPLYAWIDAVARQGPTNAAINGSVTVRAWHALGGGDSSHTPAPELSAVQHVRRHLAGLPPAAGRVLLRRSFPLLIAALNRAGMGPLEADVSPRHLRRAGLRAMGEVAGRLGFGANHVIFGHTHRAGPLPGDDPAEWLIPAGGSLYNCGCWTYERAFLSPAPAGENPYWPGSCVVVPAQGPPVVKRLLAGLSGEQLKAARGR